MLAQFDLSLTQKYNVTGPRYTSYPTALELLPTDDYTLYHKAKTSSTNQDLALYIHIPYCQSLCYYCGCNKLITQNTEKGDAYLELLAKEIGVYAKLYQGRTLVQLHLGGGSPTFLTDGQLKRLIHLLRNAFRFSTGAEIAIEIDPRGFDITRLMHIKALGFNRISFGIQDLNKAVLAAVNREQDTLALLDLLNRAAHLEFSGISYDLIYGLPLQTLNGFKRTIDTIINLKPARVSLFNYAHMPEKFAAQRKIDESELPSANEKLAMFTHAANAFIAAGYEYIGIDHFALPTDSLAKAKQQGTLTRNFQGYSALTNADLIGLGVSAISQVGDRLYQNTKSVADYGNKLDAKTLPIEKALLLSPDDKLRNRVIMSLLCQEEVLFSAINEEFGIQFTEYFSRELNALAPYQKDKLIILESNKIKITPKGRVFARLVCKEFDKYLKKVNKGSYSRII